MDVNCKSTGPSQPEQSRQWATSHGNKLITFETASLENRCGFVQHCHTVVISATFLPPNRDFFVMSAETVSSGLVLTSDSESEIYCDTVEQLDSGKVGIESEVATFPSCVRMEKINHLSFSEGMCPILQFSPLYFLCVCVCVCTECVHARRSRQ